MRPSRSGILAEAISMHEVSTWVTIPFFGANLPKKGISKQKRKKWTSLLNSELV